MDTSIGIFPYSTDLYSLNYLMKLSGESVNPIQLPSTNTLVIPGILAGWISLSNSLNEKLSPVVTISLSNVYLSYLLRSLDTDVINDRFFTIPILAPSGVSAGHMNP